jgi:hypothetical protein
MERIQALIDKLYQQKQQNCNPAQLLLTVQLLQSELVKYQQRNGSISTGKVAVTLPVNMNFFEEEYRSAKTETPEVQVQPVVEQITKAEISKPASQPSFEQNEYILFKPEIKEVRKEEPKKEEPKPSIAVTPVFNPAFETTSEAPTLAQYQPKKESHEVKELHEVIAEHKESLNDRLKQEKLEVAHKLKDTPIKDLRKAIGVNDRFTFVSELFRGDDAMYERSLKTINGFHILSEAEYWINRELKFKLGWNDNNDTVQYFYQLVRRRFS